MFHLCVTALCWIFSKKSLTIALHIDNCSCYVSDKRLHTSTTIFEHQATLDISLSLFFILVTLCYWFSVTHKLNIYFVLSSLFKIQYIFNIFLHAHLYFIYYINRHHIHTHTTLYIHCYKNTIYLTISLEKNTILAISLKKNTPVSCN